MSLFLSVIAALLLDALLGEPKRAHPLVAFGRLADRLEQHFNGAAGRGWRSHGVTAWCLAVLPLTLLAWLLSSRSSANCPFSFRRTAASLMQSTYSF